MMSDISVLVASCDNYEDAWTPFFQNFFRQWPDCPYPIYLQTNFLRPQFENVITLTTGEDKDWSSNLKDCLNLINSEKILLLLEDFWLWQRVQTDTIVECARMMDELNAGYFRLVPKPPPDSKVNHSLNIGRIQKGANYRVSFQAGIWRHATLQNVLLPGENAWEAETGGSVRSCQLDEEFLSIDVMPKEQWPIRYLNAIIKRKWTPEAIRTAKSLGVVLDLKKRPVCNWYDQWRRKKHFRKAVNFIASLFKLILGRRGYAKFKNFSFIKKIIY